MIVTTIIERGPNADILAMGASLLKESPPGTFSNCTLFESTAPGIVITIGTRYPRSLPPHARCSSVTLSAHDPDGSGKHAHVILRFGEDEQMFPSVTGMIGALEDAGARFNDTSTPSKP